MFKQSTEHHHHHHHQQQQQNGTPKWTYNRVVVQAVNYKNGTEQNVPTTLSSLEDSNERRAEERKNPDPQTSIRLSSQQRHTEQYLLFRE